MSDQDRLREYLRQRITNISTAAEDDVVALIAREVRLGRYDELTKVEVYETYADTIEYIRNRERELKKELKSE